MVNHKEILRLKSLGLTHREIAEGAGCGHNTVTRTLACARERRLSRQQSQSMSPQEVAGRLFPAEKTGNVCKAPDYEWVHREMQKSGVTLNLLFLSLGELNQAIRKKLEEFNRKTSQKREGSRASCFAEERLFLLPLPAQPFELAVWKVATVQYNYHISYEYIKQQVDVRLTQTTVEIFFSGTRIASHLRLHGRSNQYSTVEEHMPPDHRAYLQWNGERFVRWAEQIGKHIADRGAALLCRP